MTSLFTVSISCANLEEAERVARRLVEDRLAACVQVHPIRSFYIWQEKLEEADEVLIVAKTLESKLDALEASVKALHSYEVPEIVATCIEFVNAEYAEWFRSVLPEDDIYEK